MTRFQATGRASGANFRHCCVNSGDRIGWRLQARDVGAKVLMHLPVRPDMNHSGDSLNVFGSNNSR
jgi:hypothetical protein